MWNLKVYDFVCFFLNIGYIVELAKKNGKILFFRSRTFCIRL